MYSKIQLWKLWLFLKLTVGWWDEELVKIFDVKDRCEKLDLDPTSHKKLEEKMLTIIGETRSICWQVRYISKGLLPPHLFLRPRHRS